MDRILKETCRSLALVRAVTNRTSAMLRRCSCALLLVTTIGSGASANTIWLGTVDDNWSNAANWDIGVPDLLVPQQRAQIEGTTDPANWPVIKSGETVNLNQRLFLPLAPVGAEPTTYARLTIESGGTINATSDFRAGEDDGNEFQQMIGSLNVAGALTIGNRARFGNNDFMTIEVDVTGSVIHTSSQQAFRIGGGEEATANFSIAGTGFVSTAGSFEMGDGGLLSLSDDATLTLFEYVLEDEDDEGNPIFIPVTKPEIITSVTNFAAAGLMEGLTNTYTGAQTLIPLGNGLSYYEDTTSITIVAAASAAIPGDLNLDGSVDARDYVFWRNNMGPELDYIAWREHFGDPEAAAASGIVAGLASVPESSTAVLLSFFLSSLTWLRVRRCVTRTR